MFEWSQAEGGSGGRAHFIATLEVTGYEYTFKPYEMWKRFACVGILTQLRGQALTEAFESLVHLYQWQLEQSQIVVRHPQRRAVPVSQVRRVDRVPFTIDDE